jgi:hypothetical protein
MRTVRESMRAKILELEADYKVLPNAFLPWLAMDCTNTRNFIPNTRSSPRMPEEIVNGVKVNFRTDITASFGQLVLVKTNNVSSDGVPITKQDYAIALGRVIGTTGAVWVYRMNAARVVSRRVIKAIPMTEEWRQHINELAKRRPIDATKFFEFKSTLAYGPEDHEDVERVTVQPSDRSSVIQPQWDCNRNPSLPRKSYSPFKLRPLYPLVSAQHRPAYRYHLCHSAHRRIQQHHLCLRSTRDECRLDQQQLRQLRINPLQLAQLQCTSHRPQ